MDRNRARSGAVVLLAAIAAVGLSGCGGSNAPAVAKLGPTTSSGGGSGTATDTAGSGAPPTKAQMGQDLLRYAQCMRSHGVPNFTDPSAGGGFVFQPGAGLDPSSPIVEAARAKCLKFLAGGGPPGPGSVTHPSSRWLAQMVRAAQCMRRHGFPGFPDPRTSVPENPFGNSQNGVISDIDGVIFLFPGSIDIKSPQFLRAATECDFPHHGDH